ncbi:MAG TPA: hypothetical protein DEB24_03590, partial [Coriobacteriia bacterium]|nr:hypothetical protein [Coriobacteriia bacterium]
MLCANCGKDIPDISGFCPYCGSKQAEAPIESQPTGQAEAAAGGQQIPAVVDQVQPVQPVSASPVQDEARQAEAAMQPVDRLPGPTIVTPAEECVPQPAEQFA